MSSRKCAACGHDPSCGFASHWTKATGQRWYCHADDHSCYVGLTLADPLDEDFGSVQRGAGGESDGTE